MARRQMSNKRRFHRFGKKRYCYFCDNPNLKVDYKNVELMRKYLSDRGKIVAKRISGTCNKHQRRIAKEIKRARFIALVPFTVQTYR